MGGSFLLDRSGHADPARARAHFEMARRYFQVDEYRKAIEEFKAAHVEEPDPAFLYNIAECYRHLGETRDALVFYRRFLTLAPPNAASRTTAEKRIAELQGARPAPAAPPLTVPPPAPVRAEPRPEKTAEPRAGVKPLPPPAESHAMVAPAPPMSIPAPTPAPAPAPAFAPSVSLAASPEESARPADDEAARARPFYKSGWFYVLLGGALVAGTAAVWALSSNGKTSVPETPLGNKPAFP